jgi:hypothetical protein
VLLVRPVSSGRAFVFFLAVSSQPAAFFVFASFFFLLVFVLFCFVFVFVFVLKSRNIEYGIVV